MRGQVYSREKERKDIHEIEAKSAYSASYSSYCKFCLGVYILVVYYYIKYNGNKKTISVRNLELKERYKKTKKAIKVYRCTWLKTNPLSVLFPRIGSCYSCPQLVDNVRCSSIFTRSILSASHSTMRTGASIFKQPIQ